MARVTGGLFSVTAVGKFAKVMVFAYWKGRQYVRMLVQPANPRSAAQLSMRAWMTFLSQIWDGLSAGDKATWETRAEDNNYAPFNAFCSVGMSRVDLYQGPGTVDPITDTGDGGTAPTTTPTSGVKQVSLSIADGGTPPDWGWVIHRSTSTGFTPGRATAVAVIERTGTPTVYQDAPLPTGVQQFYRVQGFSEDGVMGALEAEVTGTPT